MTQHSVAPTDYPEVNSVLRELLSGAQRTLGDHFVGMYLDGSLAIGDFDLDKSDIDFVVVTDAEVSEDTFGVLKTMHDRFAGGASKWGRELEGSYISQRALRYDRRPAAHPYIDRGSVLAMVQQETGYWPIHRHMLREYGVVLAGPPPRVLIDPVAPEDLREAVRGILREWWTPMLTEGPRLQNGFYRCYAVLTMSRMLYTLRHGTIVTKPFAAQWVQGAFDRRWTSLIQRALAWSQEAPPDLGETLAFIQHTSEFSNQHGADVKIMDPKAQVRESYNRIAATYLSSRHYKSADVALLDDLVVRLPPRARVLDAGCGAGVPIARQLATRANVVGVDFAEVQLGLARRHVPTGLWVCGDLVALPFADASFDAVCSYYAVIHIPREEHAAVLGGFARVLRSGGLALLCLGAADLPAWTEQYHGEPMYWSHYDAPTSLSLVEAAGFKLVWDRWVADGSAGHLFVLAQRRDA